MNPGQVCICTLEGIIRGCPRHHPVPAATPGSAHAMLIRILENQEKIMTALDNLQAADTALKAEVTQAITDWQNQLAGANTANDPAIQAVADDMNNVVAQLQGADPASTAASGTASGTPGTDTAGTGTSASSTGTTPAS